MDVLIAEDEIRERIDGLAVEIAAACGNRRLLVARSVASDRMVRTSCERLSCCRRLRAAADNRACNRRGE